MTPPATAAARHAVAGRAGSGSRVATPRPQRRVSGPARPARPVAVPRRSAPRAADLPLGARALAWLRTLPDHRLLDRLIGGRIWIVLLGTLLVGIVTMQLTLLRWNAGIGRAVERGSQLEQRNAALRLSNSQLSDSERIVALATQMGYVMPPQGSPRFLSVSAGDAAKALTTMRVPDPAAAAAVTTTTDPATTTTGLVAATTDPTATAVDPTAATADPAAATTDPVASATDPATTPAPAAATTTPASGTAAAPATGTAAPTTATPVAGGASVPVGPRG